MNYRKIMLVALVLLTIITMSAVSAADDVDALTIIDEGDDGTQIAEAPSSDDEISSDSEGLIGAPEENVDDFNGEPGDKYNVTMNVYRPDKVYLQDDIEIHAEVYATVGEDTFTPDGDVVFYLNGIEHTREIASWGPTSYLTIREFGVYDFKVEFVPYDDDQFNGAVEEFTYIVNNSMYRIDVEDNIPYGRSIFNVYAPVMNVDDIVITIKGKKFNVRYDDDFGDYICNASALDYGLNTVNIYYPGDEKFAEYSADANITVISRVYVDDENPVYGNPYEFGIKLPSDATGKLTVYYAKLDEDDVYTYTEIASDNAKNGIARVILNDLPVGQAEVFANFTGSVDAIGEYFSVYIYPRVTVPKAVKFGDEAYITVETSSGATGTINVQYYEITDDSESEYADFDSKEITGAITKFSLSGLKKGVYNFWVQYVYDEDNGGYFSDSHIVYVLDTIDVDLNITSYPENVLPFDMDDHRVYFELPPYAEGDVAFYIDGKLMETRIADAYDCFTFTSYNFTLGEHSFSVNFTSPTQGASSEAAKFNVVPAVIQIPDKMNINSHFVSANDISVEVNPKATGVIIIMIDNVEYLTQNVVSVDDDGRYYIFNLAEVSRGKHDVTVTFRDDKYGIASVNKTVEFGYEIQIDTKDIYGFDNVINLTLPRDLGNGDLTITLDGNKVSGTRNSNLISVNPGKLSPGNHTVLVKYAGDAFYPAENFNQTFEVYPQIQVEYNDILIGSDKGVTLMLPGDAKGKLNVTVKVEYDDGDNWGYRVFDSKLVSFANGRAYYSYADLPLGYYEIYASYTGNDYAVADAMDGFYVRTIDWGDNYLRLGENKTITFISQNSEPGQLRVVLSRFVDYSKDWDDPVNVVETINVPINNKKATHTFTNLQFGDYHLFVAEEFLNGTPKGYEDDKSFYVSSPMMDIDSGDFELGNITPFVIEFPADANGKVTVIVRGNYSQGNTYRYKTAEYPVNGVTTINLNDLIKEIGTFGVYYNYTGNYGKYVCEEDFYYNIIQGKINPTIEVTADKKIVEGTPLTVNVNIAGATGKIRVNGKDADLVNGKASVELSDLPLGDNNITVLYGGDKAYNRGSASIMVNVYKKVEANLKVSVSDIMAGEKAMVNVEINPNATGKLTINGIEAAIAGGRANLSLSDCPVGENVVEVKFAGDEYVLPANATATFKVFAEPVITAKNTKVLYTAKGKFSVTVNGTDGKVANGTEVIFTIAGKQVANVTTDANGVATYIVKKVPGTYQVTATALGVSATKKLTVKHLVTLKSVTVKKSAKKLVLQATLSKVNGKYLKNKKVTFKFNGKTYKAKTNAKGVAKYTIKKSVLKKLKVGKKITYKATYLKDTVKKTAKVKK